MTDSVVEHFTTKSGTAMRHVTLTVRYDFYAVDGSSMSATVMGEAADSGDKATSKALSMAFKYALTEVLTLPTNEPDADETTHELGSRAASPPQTTRRPPPQNGTRRTAPLDISAPSETISESGAAEVVAAWEAVGVKDREKRLLATSAVIEREITSTKDLTPAEANKLLLHINRLKVAT